MVEFGVERLTISSEDAGCHGDPGLPQQAQAASAVCRIWVNGAYDNPCNPRMNERVRAGRGASVRAAGFQSDVGGGTAGVIGGQFSQGLNFGMWKARAAMPAARDDAAVRADYDTADCGIWVCVPPSAPRKADGFVHEGFVRCHAGGMLHGTGGCAKGEIE